MSSGRLGENGALVEFRAKDPRALSCVRAQDLDHVLNRGIAMRQLLIESKLDLDHEGPGG